MPRDYGPPPEMATSQAEACRLVVEVLELGPEYGALTAYCQGLAEVIDQRPGQATLWAEYRPALELLISAGDTGVDESHAQLLELVRSSVGDA